MNKNKALVTNIFSLLILQGTTYILPLLTFPYLVRILGEDQFGIIVFSSAVIQYLIIFCDFGFNYTSTRKISLHNNNIEKISEIFSSTITIKLIMCVVSFFGMILVINFVPKYEPYLFVFVINFIQVLGNVLFPVWFYQGMEKMKFITIINVIARVLATLSIFLLVKSQDDLVLAVLLQSLGFLLSGVVAFIFAITHFKIKVSFSFNLKNIINEVKESWKVFVSTLSINVYNQGSVIILGLFTNNTIVGYFGIAQKIVHAATGLSQPFAQALYPYLCKLFIENKAKYRSIMKMMKFGSMFVALMMLLVIYFFSDFLVSIVTGAANKDVSVILEYWSFIAFFIFNNIILNGFVLSMGKYDQMQKMYMIASILFLVVSPLLTSVWSTGGMSISLLIVEVCIFVGSLSITRDRGIRDLGK